MVGLLLHASLWLVCRGRDVEVMRMTGCLVGRCMRCFGREVSWAILGFFVRLAWNFTYEAGPVEGVTEMVCVLLSVSLK